MSVVSCVILGKIVHLSMYLSLSVKQRLKYHFTGLLWAKKRVNILKEFQAIAYSKPYICYNIYYCCFL